MLKENIRASQDHTFAREIMRKVHKQHTRVIEAAGGLLCRESLHGQEIALVYRPKYKDWTLPKGKREEGETWQETALREVLEETGYKACLEAFAGCTAYLVRNTPKIVLFWHMTPIGTPHFIPGDEVDQIQWCTLSSAQNRITYDNEKNLIEAYFRQVIS